MNKIFNIIGCFFLTLFVCSLVYGQDFIGGFHDFGGSHANQIFVNTNGWGQILQASHSTVQSALDQIDDAITSSSPTEPTDSCTPSQLAFDSSFLYVCISSNTWERVAIATWSTSASFILQEDGSSYILQEDGSSKITIE